MRWLLASLLILSLSGNAAARASSEPVILIVGDSLSAAYRMPQASSWPSLLQERLAAHGLPHRVANASISGETTTGGVRRLPALLDMHQPQWVIIELGGNDGLRGMPVSLTRQNLEDMVQKSQQAGAEVMLAGIRLPPNYGPAFTQPFEAIYPELASEYDTLLLPFILEGVAMDPAYMLDDGIHPNVAAQPILLENVWQVLAAHLEEREVTPTP